MGAITVGEENSTTIELYYEDHGDGAPVVLLGGWPLDSRSWEPQVLPLLQAGHRVVVYDRRGFGRSSRKLARYVGAQGTERLKACLFIESLAPSFVKSEENPGGVDQAAGDEVRQAIFDDRAAWLNGCSQTSSTSTTISASGSAGTPCTPSGTPGPRRRRSRPGPAPSPGSTTSPATSSGSTFRP